MIELQLIHLVFVAIGTILTFGLTLWKVLSPLIKAVRASDKWRSDQEHEIQIIKKDIEHGKDSHDSLKTLVSHNHKEVMTILRKLEVEFGDMKSTRGANQERLDGFEKRLEKLEQK